VLRLASHGVLDIGCEMEIGQSTRIGLTSDILYGRAAAGGHFIACKIHETWAVYVMSDVVRVVFEGKRQVSFQVSFCELSKTMSLT